MSVSAGVIFHGFGNFVIPLTNEFGWNRTTISFVIAVGRLQTGLVGPLEGWAIDRYGPRRMMLIGVPPCGARLRGDEPHRLPVRLLRRVPADDCGWQRFGPGDADDRGCGELVQTPARPGLWNRVVGRRARGAFRAARRVDDQPLRVARHVRSHWNRDIGRGLPHRYGYEAPPRAVRLPSRRRRSPAGKDGRAFPRGRSLPGLLGPRGAEDIELLVS